MRVSSLTIFPVKSCRGTSLQEMSLDDRGPAHDRRWMLIDDNGEFLTQREHPRLSVVTPSVTPAGITLSAPGMPDLAVGTPNDGGSVMTHVWGDPVQVQIASAEAAEWFSAFLGDSVRLAYLTDETVRTMRGEYAGAIRERRRVSLSDGAPLLLATDASLADLNARLQTPIPMNRFRPNVVVEGTAPWAEDNWRRIAIGEVTFEVAKPCARCATTTVDQTSGVRGVEPLRTLASFRRRGTEVFFGQNLAHHAPGVIRVGNPVHVLEGKGG